MGRVLSHRIVFLVALATGGTLEAGPALCGVPGDEPASVPSVLTRAGAVAWALQNHPDLAAIRQQHGIAAAAVVIAETYPFNPIAESRVQSNSGPASAGITNQVSVENFLLLELELRHQGTYRRASAAAALSRTEWEIANQELVTAIRVLRAFNVLLYRQEKLRLARETLQLNEKLIEQVRKLMEAGRLRGADLFLARTEALNTRTAVGVGQTALVRAWADFYRALGIVGCHPVELVGSLDVPLCEGEPQALLEESLSSRPDLRARQAAVADAEARLKLETANRWGNPIIGSAYIYDPTRISEIGAQINLPLPVLNKHTGEILRAEAERNRALLDLRQMEVQVRQDVEAALARFAAARSQVETYRSDVLPELRRSLEAVERLFAQGEPGVDVLRVIDLQRKLLQAQDGYLDALAEEDDSHADLAAALGDPAFGTATNGEPCPGTSKPAAP